MVRISLSCKLSRCFVFCLVDERRDVALRWEDENAKSQTNEDRDGDPPASCCRFSEASSQHKPTHSLDEEDRLVLHLTVLTLYKDQIKPQQAKIKHRLQELHGSPFLEQNFLQLYEEFPERYRVETLDDGVAMNATVYLRDTPS